MLGGPPRSALSTRALGAVIIPSPLPASRVDVSAPLPLPSRPARLVAQTKFPCPAIAARPGSRFNPRQARAKAHLESGASVRCSLPCLTQGRLPLNHKRFSRPASNRGPAPGLMSPPSGGAGNRGDLAGELVFFRLRLALPPASRGPRRAAACSEKIRPSHDFIPSPDLLPRKRGLNL